MNIRKAKLTFGGESSDKVRGELDNRRVRRTAAESADVARNSKMEELDLHGGLRPDQARSRIWEFIFNLSKKEVSFCRIIHGAGTGRLEKTTLEILGEMQTNGEILEFFPSINPRLIGAAQVVLLVEKNLD